MNIKPKFVYYDIRRKQSVCLIMYTHENDVDTQVLEVSMLDDGEPIELDADYTYSAVIVNRETKALIDDNISCELNDSGNVLIPIDNFHTLGAQDLLIELTITDSDGNQVLVTPFPLWIHVNASILDDAQVTPESEGTVPELLEEAKEALEDAQQAIEDAGDYNNLDNKPSINGHELVGDQTDSGLGLQSLLEIGYKIGDNAYYETNLSGALIPSDSVNIWKGYNGTRYEYSFNIDNDFAFNTFHPTQVDLDAWGTTQYVGNSYAKLVKRRISNLPSFINAADNSIIEILNFGMYAYRLQFISWKDPVTNISRLAFRHVDLTVNNWREITEITSATVNQNGTITFTMSDGSTVTTTGESVIGPQGPAGADGNDYVLTNQDKSDIADLVLAQLPTTQGVQYGN